MSDDFNPQEVDRMMDLESRIGSGYDPSPQEIDFMMGFEDRLSSPAPEPSTDVNMEFGRADHGDSFLANRVTEPISEVVNDYINEPLSNIAMNTWGGQMAAGAASQIAKPLGGVMEWAGDTAAGFGWDDNPLQRYGENIRDNSDLVAQVSRDRFGADDSFAKGLAYDVGSSTMAALPILAAGAISAPAALASPLTLGYFGSTSAGDEYAELRDAGYGYEAATGFGGLYGVGTVALERLPVGKFLDPSISSGIKRVAKTGVSEGIEEGSQAAMDIAYGVALKDRDMPTLGEAAREIGYSGLVGTTSGGIMGGVGHGVNSVHKANIQRQFAQQREVDEETFNQITNKVLNDPNAQKIVKQPTGTQTAPPSVDDQIKREGDYSRPTKPIEPGDVATTVGLEPNPGEVEYNPYDRNPNQTPEEALGDVPPIPEDGEFSQMGDTTPSDAPPPPPAFEAPLPKSRDFIFSRKTGAMYSEDLNPKLRDHLDGLIAGFYLSPASGTQYSPNTLTIGTFDKLAGYETYSLIDGDRPLHPDSRFAIGREDYESYTSAKRIISKIGDEYKYDKRPTVQGVHLTSSASLTSSGVPMSVVIGLKTGEWSPKNLAVASHELAHAVDEYLLQKSPEIREAMRKEWEAARDNALKKKTIGEADRHLGAFYMAEEKNREGTGRKPLKMYKGTRYYNYRFGEESGFDEWVANQIAEWAMNPNNIAETKAQRLMRDIGRFFRKIWESFQKTFPQQAPTLREWLDEHFDKAAYRGVVSKSKPKATKPIDPLDDPLDDPIDPIGALTARLHSEAGVDMMFQHWPALLAKNAYQGYKATSKMVTDALRPKDKSLSTEAPDYRDDAERLLSGEIFGTENKVLGKARQRITFGKTLAEKSPLYRRVYEAMLKLFDIQQVNVAEAAESLAPYSTHSTEGKARVNKALMTQRIASEHGLHYSESKQSLMKNLGLLEEDVAAYQAVRKTMIHFTEKIREALKADVPRFIQKSVNGDFEVEADALTLEKYHQRVDALADELAAGYYVPATRFGKLIVQVDDYVDKSAPYGEQDKKGWFSLHETEAERQATIKMLSEQGYTKKQIVSDTLKDTNVEGIDMLPTDIIERARDLGIVPEVGEEDLMVTVDVKKLDEPTGFRGKLTKAKLVPGFTQNLERAINDYALGASYWHANKMQAKEFRMALDDIKFGGNVKIGSIFTEGKDAKGRKRAIQKLSVDNKKIINKNLYDRAKEDIEYVRKGTEEFQQLRQFMAMWFLSRPVTALVNGTQTFTMTLPEAIHHLGARKGAKAAGVGFLRLTNLQKKKLSKEQLSQAQQELSDGLDLAVKEGLVSAEALKAMTGQAAGKRKLGKISSKVPILGGKDLADAPLLLFSETEKLNRMVAFAIGFEVANKKKLKGAERQKFAEDFVRETQFDYSKANRPPISRGYAAPLFAFRLFPFFQLRWLRNRLSDKDYKAVGTHLAMQLLLGGITAMPLIKDPLKLLEMSGLNPKALIREFLGSFSDSEGLEDMLIYGLAGVGTLMDEVESLNIIPGAGIKPEDIPFWDTIKDTFKAANISSSLAAPELAPDIEYGIGAALIKTILGSLSAFGTSQARYQYYLDSGLPPEIAREVLHPPILHKGLETNRWAREGELRMASGTLKKELSPVEQLFGYLGFNHLDRAKFYEQRHGKRLTGDRSRDNDNMNKKLTNSIFDYMRYSKMGDKKRADAAFSRAEKVLSKVREDKQLLSEVLRGENPLQLSPEAARALTNYSEPHQASIKRSLKHLIGQYQDPYYVEDLPKKARPEAHRVVTDVTGKPTPYVPR